MAQPTTGVLFSSSFPPASPGNQLVLPQTNGGQPAQFVTFQPQPATAALLGVVKPDGTTTTVDADGTIHAVGGTGSGGTSASNGSYICVVPSGAKDTSNTLFIIPAPVLAGTGYFYVRNGVMQRQLGTKAEFAVQGSTITTTTPLASDDWHEFYYVMGTPNSESGGGGGVTPTPVAIRGTSTGAAASGAFTIAFPAAAIVGDLVVICANNDWNISAPSGWNLHDLSNGVSWNGIVCSKVMTSGDIATGHVTITAGGSNDWTYIATAFVGPTNGVREADAVSMGAGSPVAVTTSSAVAATDWAIYYGSGRASSGSVIGISRGVHQTSITGANSQAELNTEQLTAGGAYTTNFTFTGAGAGTYFAVVIVKG